MMRDEDNQGKSHVEAIFASERGKGKKKRKARLLVSYRSKGNVIVVMLESDDKLK